MTKFVYGLTLALLFVGPVFSNSEQLSQDVVQMSELPKRPQEPQVPYPYNEEEVSFKNASDGVTLVGTLTLPRSKGPFPVVILLHGSAPLDRDFPMFGHKPFLVCADYLTKGSSENN